MFKKSALFSLFHIGGTKYEASVFKFVTGKYGDKYGTPNDLLFARIADCINIPMAIPKKPAIYPNIIYRNLHILRVNPSEKSGIAKELIAVIATIIIKIGLTKFALTDASPKY